MSLILATAWQVYEQVAPLILLAMCVYVLLLLSVQVLTTLASWMYAKRRYKVQLKSGSDYLEVIYPESYINQIIKSI